MDSDKLFELLEMETNEIDRSHRAAIIAKIASKYYKDAPGSNEAFLSLCEHLIASNNMCLFSIATLWLKKRKSIIEIKYFPVIEGWLCKYIHSWGTCDQFCYRILNPFVYKYPELYSDVLKWAASRETYIRRAALVSLICSGEGNGFKVDYDLKEILTVTDILKIDSHPHIQKAAGWLLKYSYLTYPDEIIDYLKENSKILSRTSYRYALEKVPKDLRKEMMKL